MTISDFEQRVLDELKEISEQLARSDERIKVISKSLDASHSKHKAHETRLGNLERWKVWVVGVATGVSLVVSTLISFVVFFLKKVGLH